MQLGAFSVSLSVEDMAASRSFYENLGFSMTGGDGESWTTVGPIETELVIVQLPKPQDRLMQVLLKITHGHEIDRDLYRVGGPLVGRFAEAIVQG